jgi:hypothetical protein
LLSLILAFSMLIGVSVPQQPMSLRLSSPEYLFQRGHVRLSRTDAVPNTEGHAGVFPEQPAEAIEDQEATLEKNLVHGVRFFPHATYRCTLIDVEILRLSDQTEFRVPYFGLPEFSLSDRDLEQDTTTVNVRPGGVFRIVALDREGKSIPRKKLTFMTTGMTISIKTDKNGEIIFLGNPTQYHIALPDENMTRVLIAAL